MKQEEMEKVCQLNELVRERLRVESVLPEVERNSEGLLAEQSGE